MCKKFIIFIVLLFILTLFFKNDSYCYVIPTRENAADFFYVFGKDGHPGYGASDNLFILFVAIPDHTPENLMIRIFDPGVGERHDERYGVWNTSTKFSIYGGRGAFSDSRARHEYPIKDYDTGKLLYSMTFSDKDKYDDHWMYIGPFALRQGEHIGDYYMFKIVVEGLEGNDNNLFKFNITPDNAEIFTYRLPIRLAEQERTRMNFFPLIPQGTDRVEVSNFNLGCRARVDLVSDTLNKRYEIDKSHRGKYRHTLVNIEQPEKLQKWILQIIRGRRGEKVNATFSIKDKDGNPLRIYFKPKPLHPQLGLDVAKLECNEFIFDASSSYDVNNLPLSFHWNFGDGNTSTEPIIKHTYKKGGDYEVTLTVRNTSDLACNTSSTTQTIRVNSPPEAAFTAPDIACINENILVDASDTIDHVSEYLTYIWDFGDNTEATGEKVRKSYKEPGHYKITLTVDDNEGTTCSTDTATRKIHINTPTIAKAGNDKKLCLDDFYGNYILTFDASESLNGEDKQLTYFWDFGDGNTAEGKIVTHEYRYAGDYTVKLEVDDRLGSSCSVSIDTLNVILNKRPIANAGKDMNICLGETIEIDGSRSKTEPGQTLSYHWELQDGITKTGSKILYTFDKAGKHIIKLTVDDNRGLSCSTNTDQIKINVNTKPVAHLDSIDRTCINTSVLFDASKSYDPDGDNLTYTWDFGDNTVKSTGPVVEHTYRKGGLYTVRLTVDDGKGLKCSKSIITKEILVNTSPVADTGPAVVCCVNAENIFDASKSYDPDGDTLTYFWDFGDGNTAEGKIVTHTYKKPGQYKVQLTVDDGLETLCSIDTASFIANVEAEPVPVMKIERGF